MKTFVQCCNDPKYYVQDCRKTKPYHKSEENINCRLYNKSWKQDVVSMWKIFCGDSRNQIFLLQKPGHTRATEA